MHYTLQLKRDFWFSRYVIQDLDLEQKAALNKSFKSKIEK
jgi:hypothetical protein